MSRRLEHLAGQHDCTTRSRLFFLFFFFPPGLSVCSSQTQHSPQSSCWSLLITAWYPSSVCSSSSHGKRVCARRAFMRPQKVFEEMWRLRGHSVCVTSKFVSRILECVRSSCSVRIRIEWSRRFNAVIHVQHENTLFPQQRWWNGGETSGPAQAAQKTIHRHLNMIELFNY